MGFDYKSVSQAYNCQERFQPKTNIEQKEKKSMPVLNYLEVDIKKVVLATRGIQLWNNFPRWLMG